VPVNKGSVCPVKTGTFGIDFDKLDGCNTCQIWDDCSAEAERQEQAEKEARAAGRMSRGRGK
jgi:hypothetical protein